MATIGGWIAAGAIGTTLGPGEGATDGPPRADSAVESRGPEDPRDRARALAAMGDAAFEARLYVEASDAYREAYALDPVPVFLFAWARVEQEAGRCREAIALYQRFIASGPPARDVDQANLEVGRCYGLLSEAEPPAAPQHEPPPQTETTPGASEPPSPEAPPTADPLPGPRAPWLRDPWGGVVLATGLVGLGVGTGLYLQARAEVRRAERATTTDDFRAASRRAATFSGAGIAGWTVGSALMLGAVVRYAVVARRGDSPRLGASPLGLWARF